MRLTEKDHKTRLARLADGTSPDPDDDRRLVKLYERVGPQSETVGATEATVEWVEPPQRARRGRSAQR